MKLVKGTKVELRLTKRKMPVEKLKDLPGLLNHDLFSFLKLRESIYEIKREGLPWRAYIKVLAFQKRVDEVGFSQAKKEFNKTKNFEKTVGKYLSKSKIDLEKISQRKLKKYFSNK